MDIQLRALKQLVLLSHNAILSKILAGAGYGATAYIYGPATIADLELNSSQCLLLGLLHTLVTQEVMSCCMLAEVCFQVKQLQSDHLRVWLVGDFVFPRKDMEKAMGLLGKLLTTGMLKMPPHVIRIMSSLAAKYGVNSFHFESLSEEHRGDLAMQLENAVTSNSPGDIITLASEGGDINGLTQSGDSLLHLAARADNYAAINALVYLRADMEVTNSSNITPLYEAVKNNCVHSIKALLLARAKVDKRMLRGDTYLHIAAAGSHNEALEILLEEAGMEMNEVNYYGETPLFSAVREGNIRGVNILLEKGADSNIIPEGSKSLLDMVMEVQNIDMLKELVKYRSIQDLKSEDGETVLHLVSRSGNVEMFKALKNLKHLVEIKNQNGLTPLHVASDISIVRMLIRMGMDLNSQDNNGTTPLMMASKNSKEDIVRFLLDNGANPKIKDKDGRISIHYAAEGGCIECVTGLIAIGENVDEKDNDGKTPSYFAAVNNKPNVIQLLADRGADLTLGDNDGVIHHAVRCGHVGAVTILLDAGVDVDMKGGQYQMTTLCHAAEKGHVPIIKLLLDRGADIEGKSCHGSTSLMWAAQEGHLEVVQLLIDRGAAVNATTYIGTTALKFASMNGHNAIMEYLMSKGGVQ